MFHHGPVWNTIYSIEGLAVVNSNSSSVAARAKGDVVLGVRACKKGKLEVH